jgi:hypothetical protein
MSLNIIHENCDPILAKNKQLPRNSYLVTYVFEGKIQYDVVQSNGAVAIFDKYYDTYGEVKEIKWTNGTVNPKTWNYQPPNSKKRR